MLFHLLSINSALAQFATTGVWDQKPVASQTLRPANTTTGAALGYYLRTSGSGNAFVASSRFHSGQAIRSAYVYRRSGGQGSDFVMKTHLLDATSGSGVELRLAISGDGNRVFTAEPQAGTVRYYEYDAALDDYILKQSITSPVIPGGAGFGNWIDVSDNGKRLAVSGKVSGIPGVVYIYNLNDSGVFVKAPYELVQPGSVSTDSFGSYLCISGDGNHVIASTAVGYNHVWFTYDSVSDSFVRNASFSPPMAASAGYSTRYAVNYDGTLLAYAHVDEIGVAPGSSVEIYKRTGSEISLLQVIPSNVFGGGYMIGYSISFTYDGKYLVVGGNASGNTGIFGIFEKNQSTALYELIHTFNHPPSAGGNDMFGWASEISGNGEVLPVAATYHQTNGTVYLYKPV